MSIPCEYRKLGYGFELPPGYTECEYIESTGTQWLDFEWYANGGMLCKLKGVWPTASNHGLVWSHNVIGDHNYNRNYLNSKGDNSTMEFGAGDYRVFNVPNNYKNGTTVLEVEFNTRPGIAYVKAYNQILTQFNNSTVLNPKSTVKAFYSGYELIPSPSGRLYYCTIIDVNDVVVRDLVPCLDYNGVPGMFDKITGKTFYNKGTGQLVYKIKPAPFPYGYTELEYIESTGTQWIETGVPAQINVKLQCKVQFPDGYRDQYLSALRVDSGNTRYYLLNMDAMSSSRVGLICTKYEQSRAASMNKTDGVSTPVEIESYIGDTSCYIKVDSNLYSADNLATGVPTSKTIPLFGYKARNSDVVNYFAPRSLLWYARLLVNDVAVIDLVPYLDPYGVPCMVDILTGKPYYNQGTGTFKYKLK